MRTQSNLRLDWTGPIMIIMMTHGESGETDEFIQIPDAKQHLEAMATDLGFQTGEISDDRIHMGGRHAYATHTKLTARGGCWLGRSHIRVKKESECHDTDYCHAAVLSLIWKCSIDCNTGTMRMIP